MLIIRFISALEQREEELRKCIEEYERQAEEAEKVLREDSSLPKASLFNYPSVLEKASSLIEELKKALAVKHLVQQREETLQREVDTLRGKLTRLEAGYTAHRKQSHEEKKELENQLKKMYIKEYDEKSYQGLQRVHLCRGHFKEYTNENPLFGKHVGRFWWQPMVRGDKKRGVLNKDYDVVI